MSDNTASTLAWAILLFFILAMYVACKHYA